MSWITEIKDDLTITTGDGQTYKPDYLNASKSTEYINSLFEFRNVRGTLPARRLPKSARYTLELYFTGADHITLARAFDRSAADNRYWKLYHPYYKTIFVQPLSLTIDNKDLNVSRVTVPVVETNERRKKLYIPDPASELAYKKQQFNQIAAANYAVTIPTPKLSGIQKLKNDIDKIYLKTIKAINNSLNMERMTNAYAQVNTLLNRTTYDALSIVSATQAMLDAPINFALSVKARMSVLQDQASQIWGSLMSLHIPATIQMKKDYEVYAANAITAMSLCTMVNITDDYSDRSKVYDTIDYLTSAYNEYLVNIDSIQSDNGAVSGSYIADPSILVNLQSIVTYCIANLLDVASSSKQQREIYLPKDDNVVTLAWKIYGLLPDDSTIDKIIDNNNIGANELFGLKKGRRIIYYI